MTDDLTLFACLGEGIVGSNISPCTSCEMSLMVSQQRQGFVFYICKFVRITGTDDVYILVKAIDKRKVLLTFRPKRHVCTDNCIVNPCYVRYTNC
jgi:hypothetical protein